MILLLLFFINSYLSTINSGVLTCNITIVGSGIGGLYSAFRLVKENLVSDPSGICIFESANYFGGRVEDENVTPVPGNYFGKHALRINQFQTSMRCLAQELGTLLQMPSSIQYSYTMRGIRDGLSSDAALMQSCANSGFKSPVTPTPGDATKYCSKYNLSNTDITNIRNYIIDTFGLPFTDQGFFVAECYFYQKFLNIDGCGWTKLPDNLYPRTNGSVNNYMSTRAFAQYWLGEEGLAFIRADDRFRADWISYNVSSFIDYMQEDWNYYGTNFYPVGGQSENIRRMVKYLKLNGVRMFLNNPVTSIFSVLNKLKLQTQDNPLVNTYSIIVNTPPSHFSSITGNIADILNQDAHMKSIEPVRVITIMVQWPKRWWEKYRADNFTELRVVTDSLCLNAMEFHGTAYINKMNVTRVVYNDGLECIELWAALNLKPKKFLIDELHREIIQLFNDPTIPRPLNVSLEDSAAAWHYLRASATVTNRDNILWARNPLPAYKISFVGEAYNTNRSAWQEGAVKSALYTLQYNYGLVNISKFLDCRLCQGNENGVDSNLAQCTPCGNKQSGLPYDPSMGNYVAGEPFNVYQCNPDYCPCTEGSKKRGVGDNLQFILSKIKQGDRRAIDIYKRQYVRRMN